MCTLLGVYQWGTLHDLAVAVRFLLQSRSLILNEGMTYNELR